MGARTPIGRLHHRDGSRAQPRKSPLGRSRLACRRRAGAPGGGRRRRRLGAPARRWRLQTAKGIDLTPAMTWPTPAGASDINPSSGPVLVTITYRIDPNNREAFLETIQRAGRERGRDGAYAWR